MTPLSSHRERNGSTKEFVFDLRLINLILSSLLSSQIVCRDKGDRDKGRLTIRCEKKFKFERALSGLRIVIYPCFELYFEGVVVVRLYP